MGMVLGASPAVNRLVVLVLLLVTDLLGAASVLFELSGWRHSIGIAPLIVVSLGWVVTIMGSLLLLSGRTFAAWTILVGVTVVFVICVLPVIQFEGYGFAGMAAAVVAAALASVGLLPRSAALLGLRGPPRMAPPPAYPPRWR
jgi:hypothetical protein